MGEGGGPTLHFDDSKRKTGRGSELDKEIATLAGTAPYLSAGHRNPDARINR